MLFLVDELTFYLLIIGTCGFAILLVALAVVWLKTPKPIKNFFWIWVKKRISDISFTDDGVGDILPKSIGSEGQLSGKVERLRRKHRDLKIVPRSKHAVFEKRSFWKGTGIPAFISYSGKAIANSPIVLALIEILDSKDKAMKYFKGEEIQLDPNKIKDFFKDAYDEGQFQNLIEEAYREGVEDAGKQYLKAAIPIALLIVLGVVVFVILAFFGGLQ